MNIIYLTILFPFVGFVFLACSCGKFSEHVSSVIGIGSIGLSMLTTILIAKNFLIDQQHNIAIAYKQFMWTWISIENLNIAIKFNIDGLSLTMLFVVTSISFLIHLYASWYMRGKIGYSRFFSYMNLFVSGMIILVLADNLLLMYLGWEIVGLCSYLLINFYYTKHHNNVAAMKAFIMTRIGDIFLIFAMLFLYQKIGTLNFHELMVLAPEKLEENSLIINLITSMLLFGAISKSAQVPLQTWIADAMVGPTPVSALIHAATMITAGVYLITRTYFLFLMSPNILHLIGIIGILTIILSATTALVQTDVKKILAYSTMSQVGYMFVAIGVEAWHAAIFHLMIHAFFKALLFLASGSVIRACNNEQNIFKMGGLYKSMPQIYTCFLIACSGLISLPFVTSGFYSKEEILWNIFIYNDNSLMLIMAIIGTFLTSIYTCRMIFFIFHGEEKIKVKNNFHNMNHYIPLITLAILSTYIGSLIKLPLDGIFPINIDFHNGKSFLELITGTITLIGIFISYTLWSRKIHILHNMSFGIIKQLLIKFLVNAWGFDWLYNKFFIKPYLFITSLVLKDPVKFIISTPKILIKIVNHYLLLSENGQFRWYITSMCLGIIIVTTLLLYL